MMARGNPDAVAAETEVLVEQLMQRSASDFTAANLFWLFGFIQKIRIGTTETQEREYQKAVKEIEADCEKRSNEK